jgi:adhesin/invasin
MGPNRRTKLHSPIAVARTNARTALICGAAVVAILAIACSSNSSSGVTGPPANLTITGGASLNGTVGTDIGPFIVKVTDTAGTPLPNVTVNFTASSGLTLNNTTATTNSDGTAFTSGTFSHVSGGYTITATVAGIAAPTTFHTTANPDVASAFVLASGNNQVATAGTPLGEPLVVRVTDQYGNPIPGMTVNWYATRGTIGAASNHTDVNGGAQTTFTLPGIVGPTTVTASAMINTVTVTVTFTANGT